MINRMNKIFSILSVAALLFSGGCGDGTESLSPSAPEPNYFEVDASDNSQEAQLRRSFRDDTGIYLIFSDLLATYTDEYGVQREERVDFNWGMTTSSSDNDPTFDVLEDSEKSNVTELIKRYFIPYINVEGGSMKPYSVLLVKNLEKRISSGRYMPADYVSCWRCFGINATDWIGADDDEAKSLGYSLLQSLIQDRLNYTSSELIPFFEISEEYYELEYISKAAPEWIDNQDMEIIYNLGFLDYYPDWMDDPTYDEFQNESNDFKSFLSGLFDPDFEETWKDYPQIMLKYNTLKKCIEDIGIDFNAVK